MDNSNPDEDDRYDIDLGVKLEIVTAQRNKAQDEASTWQAAAHKERTKCKELEAQLANLLADQAEVKP